MITIYQDITLKGKYIILSLGSAIFIWWLAHGYLFLYVAHLILCTLSFIFMFCLYLDKEIEIHTPLGSHMMFFIVFVGLLVPFIYQCPKLGLGSRLGGS